MWSSQESLFWLHRGKIHHARTLLIHYLWDVEKIFAVLVEKGKIRLFTEAGIPMIESHNPDSSVSTSTTMWDICMEDLPSSEKTKMDCGHCFCNNCKKSLKGAFGIPDRTVVGQNYIFFSVQPKNVEQK